MDVFEVTAVHLAELRRVLVSHDNSGGGWFLEKIVVKESTDADSKVYTFPCSKWFDKERNDGVLERLLDRGGWYSTDASKICLKNFLQ